MDGKDNVVADTLSCIPPQQVTLVDPSDLEQEGTMPGFMFNTVNTIWPGLDYQAMSLAQQSDPDVQTYRTAITSLRLEDVLFLIVLSPYCTMFLLVRRDQLYQRAGEDWFSTQCIPYHILVHEQQSA